MAFAERGEYVDLRQKTETIEGTELWLRDRTIVKLEIEYAWR